MTLRLDDPALRTVALAMLKGGGGLNSLAGAAAINMVCEATQCGRDVATRMLMNLSNPEPVETIEVHGAVAIWPDRRWAVIGSSGASEGIHKDEARNWLTNDPEGQHIAWITACIPVPRPVEVVAEVEVVDDD